VFDGNTRIVKLAHANMLVFNMIKTGNHIRKIKTRYGGSNMIVLDVSFYEKYGWTCPVYSFCEFSKNGTII